MVNKQALGRWIWTTTNGGVTAYDGFNPGRRWSSNQVDAAMLAEEIGEAERNDYLAVKAIDWRAAIRARAAELAVLHCAWTWESGAGASREYALQYGGDILCRWTAKAGGNLPRENGVRGEMFSLTPAVYLTVVRAL